MLVAAAVRCEVEPVLGDGVPVLVVNESLASAMQYVSLPPFDAARNFMIVDVGASRCSASVWAYEPDEGGGQGEEGGGGMVLREAAACTNVFVGGDEMVQRLMAWCERRKPFQESMLSSKAAIFKLRKELRAAIKTLTVAEEAMVEVDSVVSGHDLALMLTVKRGRG
jgi:molecular chaperone DnaK (HSP70)